MKIKNLAISLLLSSTIQAGLFLPYNNSTLAMYTPNSRTVYKFITDVNVNMGKLIIEDCPNKHLTKKIINDTINEINNNLPKLQILIPRTLVLGINIKSIDVDIFNSNYLKNLKYLILPNNSSVIEQISNSTILNNILEKNDISVSINTKDKKSQN